MVIMKTNYRRSGALRRRSGTRHKFSFIDDKYVAVIPVIHELVGCERCARSTYSYALGAFLLRHGGSCSPALASRIRTGRGTRQECAAPFEGSARAVPGNRSLLARSD